jgi:hypothetical protein
MGNALKAIMVFGALLIAGCNGEKCDTENCGDWGGSSSKKFLVCVGGTDLILRDLSNNEIYRCDDSAGANDMPSSCPDSFANAKDHYCKQ